MAGHIQGATSGSQGALNSIIIQYKTKLKYNEAEIAANKKREHSMQEEISSLREENSSLRKENSSLKEKNSSLEKEMGHLKMTGGRDRPNQGNNALNTKAMSVYPEPHRHDNSEISTLLSPDATVLHGGSSVPTSIKKHVPFCEEVFNNKLPSNLDVKESLQDLASNCGKKLAQLGEVQNKEHNLTLQVRNWHDISRYLLQFFAILQGIVMNLGDDDSTTHPTWLSLVLGNETDTSLRQKICKIWRILHWKIHHLLNEGSKPPAKSQLKIDEWFDRQLEMLNVPDDKELAVANLLKFISRDFGIVEEQAEGLSMSILMETEEVSSGMSSCDSSLSSSIPAEDLWTFKSLFQRLVEKIDNLSLKHGNSHNMDDLDEMERDMYLPQREALENYDLGNLLRLMSSTIQSLSQEVISINSERRYCQRCGHDVSIEPMGDRINDPTIHNERRLGHLPTGFSSAGSSPGLKSRESASQVATSGLPPLAGSALVSGGAMPKKPLAVRPVQGTFHGIHGILPPKRLTVLQNNNPHVRSKSDTSISPQQRKVIDQSLLSKPSSLDSVFKPQSVPLGIRTSPPSEIPSHQFGERFSDSDDEFQVCGPPDTPPEVKSFEGMQIGKDSNEHSPESSRRLGRLGAFSKYAMQSASQPIDNGALYDGNLPPSQVQQCTGDNSGTTQDMLLPSSVQWSTVQLKEGGMASPTLGAMSQLHTARQRSQHMNYFSAIPQEDSLLNTYSGDIERDGLDTLTNVPNASGKKDPCPVCNMVFPDYVPMKAVQSHINLHFDEGPGSFEVVSENYNSLNK